MKFSVITPTYNSEKYLSETIESIISQAGDIEIDYLIVDGGSTDGTLDIIKDYIERLEKGHITVKCSKLTFNYISEPDNGMYDAIAKGFERVKGDVVCYLNSDDFYQPNAFKTLDHIFKKYPEVRWVTGAATSYNYDGLIHNSNVPYFFYNKFIRNGMYEGRSLPFIQQESTFWRREVLNTLDISEFRSLKYSGDYYLWYSFAKKYPLFVLGGILSGFRFHSNNLSHEVAGAYHKEMEKFITKNEMELNDKIFRLYSKFAWNKNIRLKRISNQRLIFWRHKQQEWCLSSNTDISYRPKINILRAIIELILY